MIRPADAMAESLTREEARIDEALKAGQRYIHVTHLGREVIDLLAKRYEACGWIVDVSDRRQQIIDPHFAMLFSSPQVRS